MPTQTIFKKNQMQHYVATRPFTLGQSGVSVPKGSDVMFDGTKVEVGGSEYNIPGLRGAIKTGWLVPVERYDEDDTSAEIPVSANIQIRAADGGNPLDKPNMMTMQAATESDEREVGNTASHARAVNQRNTGHRPGTPVTARVGRTAEMQDGVAVRTLKTAAGSRAKNSRVVLDGSNASAAIREAQNVQIDAGQGVTEQEMLDRMQPDAAEQYLAAKASRRAQYVDDDAPVVGKIAGTQSGRKEQAGMTATLTTGRGSTDVFDASGFDPGKAKSGVVEQDGIIFRTTNGPSNKELPSARSVDAHKPVMLKDGTADARLKIARQLCPDFPDSYDFAQSPRKKLARLQADFEDRGDILRSVFAAESDEFKAVLMAEFPQAFSGE